MITDVILLYQINPVAFSCGPVSIRWYGLSYVASILIGWYYAIWLIKKTQSLITASTLSTCIPWIIFGGIGGGRLGDIVLYDFTSYIKDPIKLTAIFDQGMSFHGGLLGAAITLVFFCRWKKIAILALGDILAAGAPLGLFLGRIANFINVELYGRPTLAPWGIVLPQVDALPRHPSQIYEATLEGLLLFFLLARVSLKTRLIKEYHGLVLALFLLGYSLSRISTEVFKETRSTDLVYLRLNITYGQLMTVPVLIASCWILISIARRINKESLTRKRQLTPTRLSRFPPS